MAERDGDFASRGLGRRRGASTDAPPREYNGDKLIVTRPEDDERVALELGYRLARARVLMDRARAPTG